MTKHRLIRGLTLIEVILALSISMAIMVTTISSVKFAEDASIAKASSDHMKTIGLAAAAYIKENQKTLSMVTGITSLEVSSLKSSGYLPATTSDTNPWGSAYKIAIKTLGAPPFIEALVVSSRPASIGGQTRLDIAGESSSLLGEMGGFSMDGLEIKGTSSDGYVWTRSKSDYPGLIDAAGQTGFLIETGWISSAGKRTLRRDGANSMAGDFNLGDHHMIAGGNLNGDGSLVIRDVIAAESVNAANAISTNIAAAESSFKSSNMTVAGNLETGSLSVANVRTYEECSGFIACNIFPLLTQILFVVYEFYSYSTSFVIAFFAAHSILFNEI